MSIRPTVLIAIIAVPWLTLAGCSTPKSAELKAVGSATVRVDPENRRTLAKVRLANDVTLVLPPANPPGYVWLIAAHDSRFLHQRTEIMTAADPAKGSTVTFIAVRLGVTRLRFVLVESAEKTETNPTDFREVELTIQ